MRTRLARADATVLSQGQADSGAGAESQSPLPCPFLYCSGMGRLWRRELPIEEDASNVSAKKQNTPSRAPKALNRRYKKMT